MKTLCALLLFTTSAFAQTNFFPLLQVGDKAYTNATIRSVTAADAIVTFDGGGARIALSSLPPDLQKRFGYDAEKAAKATADMAARKNREDALYQTASAKAAFERSYMNALSATQRFYEAKIKALLDNVENSKTRLTQLRNQVFNLRTQKDAAWNRYIYTSSGVSSHTIGQIPDNEVTRLEYAQFMDRQISNTEGSIRDAEKSLEQAESDYRNQLPDIKKDYERDIAKVHETYRPPVKQPEITGTINGKRFPK